MSGGKQHQHCCSTEQHKHSEDDHDHDHGGGEQAGWLDHWPLLTALLVVVIMMVLEYGFQIIFSQPIQLLIYLPAYVLSGYNVLALAFRKASANTLYPAYVLSGYNVLALAFRKVLRMDFFNEFFLMSVATIGAFAIGSFSEGVAVMVFYSIGEWFQDSAVSNAKRSIKALLDVRPDQVTVLRNGIEVTIKPEEVLLGELIQIKPGEKVALDGALQTDVAVFNTAALTGESKPDTIYKAAPVLAGMINLNQLITVKVTAAFKDSKLSKILEMVQDATARKSQTQLFISRFAKIYTPIVFLLALFVVFLPYLLVEDYLFREWLYRGLVFLVISCPCALVVSIPLGYFGGIGLASKNGILFKGSNFLDVMTKVDTVVMDKTGTLTKGVFEVQKVEPIGLDESELLGFAVAIESKSSHPIAMAIVKHGTSTHSGKNVSSLEEIDGLGLRGVIEGKEVLAGNVKLLRKYGVEYDVQIENEVNTLVVFAIDGKYSGFISIADELKEDAGKAIADLYRHRIHTVVLSGDKQRVVDEVARQLGVQQAFGDLLPEDKVSRLQLLKDEGRRLAFVGDGVNDAPVIAMADAGIAMGGLGSDATIETADIVIQNDQPSKIFTAIQIGKLTRNIVWQNIILAMTVKVLVLILGAGGVATLWEAVIADVGVALLAILNAIRIQRINL